MSPARTGGGPAIYFLSDYGTADEFVGVVHAVLHGAAPAVAVIDLGHQVPPFDVRAGAAMLVRCAPYLGPGVVLAVVDPGVGTDRRAVAVETATGGPSWLVGPDNGLLVPLADALGGVARAVSLEPGPAAPGPPPAEPVGRTFDGRDLFAPAAAHLALGRSPALLGSDIDPRSLVTPDPGRRPGHPRGRQPSGAGAVGPVLDAEVTWVDHFGNIQLDVGPGALDQIGVGTGTTARVTVLGSPAGGGQAPAAGGGDAAGTSVPARRVHAFGELVDGEFGLVTDSTGRAALVLRQASAVRRLPPVTVGDTVRIAGEGGPPP